MTDLVSVVIPCYNVERYIEVAVRSIMYQTYKNLEIICINDGSTDSTLEILKKLQEEDQRIKIINNEFNLKLVKSLNKGIKAAQGVYLARMDGDDWSDPKRIEKQVALLENDKSVGFVGTLPIFIDSNSSKLGLATEYLITTDESIKFVSFFNPPLAHPTLVIRTSLIKNFEYNEVAVEDYDLWVRLLGKSWRMMVIPEPLFRYRINPSGYTISHRDSKREFMAKTHVGISQRMLKANGFNYIDDRNVGIISKQYFAKHYSEAREALSVFKEIRQSYVTNNEPLSKIALKEIKMWYSQRRLFIIFNAIKRGCKRHRILFLFLIVDDFFVIFQRVTYRNLFTRIKIMTSKK